MGSVAQQKFKGPVNRMRDNFFKLFWNTQIVLGKTPINIFKFNYLNTSFKKSWRKWCVMTLHMQEQHSSKKRHKDVAEDCVHHFLSSVPECHWGQSRSAPLAFICLAHAQSCGGRLIQIVLRTETWGIPVQCYRTQTSALFEAHQMTCEHVFRASSGVSFRRS